jgi:hypothetical protein
LASSGAVSETDGVVTWTGAVPVPGRDYIVSTSLDDPLCTMPLANSGAYVDLEGYGFLAEPAIDGPGPWQDPTYGGNPYAFYDNPTGTELYFTDEGYITLDINSVLTGPYVNAPIPNGGLPDALLAVLWRQMEIVYQAGTAENNRGVTVGIQLTSDSIPVAKLLEFDDVQLPGDASSQIDFEMMIAEAIDDTPGEYEVVFAYDNLTGEFTNPVTGTIGVENHAGTVGTQYAYNDAYLQTLQDGMAICFDWALVSESVEITYQTTVDAGVEIGTYLINEVIHDTLNPGSKQATADAPLFVGLKYRLYMPVLVKGSKF